MRVSITVTPQVERYINNKELLNTFGVCLSNISLFLALIKCFAGCQNESKCLNER